MTVHRDAKAVVIDDEPAMVAVVCDVLADAGIAARSCFFGVLAYPCIQREHPDLVILDIQMPGLGGIQVFEQMRANPETASIPVIFFTANAHLLDELLPDYEQQGARLLPKPFNIVRLITTVKEVLDR